MVLLVMNLSRLLEEKVLQEWRASNTQAPQDTNKIIVSLTPDKI